MYDFMFDYPTKVYFGKDVVKKNLSSILSEVKETVMLAYGGGSIKRNGIYDDVMKAIHDAGKQVVEFSGIMSNPTYEKVLEGAAIARKNNVDLILAVGGGSVIDCCKIIAAQAVMEEDIWDLELKQGKLPAVTPIALGAIVTASGTGAEMNGGAVITNEHENIKTGLFARVPKFAMLDPEYTMSVPFTQVISGAFDTLSHAMETYFGRSDEDNVSDDVAEAIMRNTIQNMKVLLKDPNNYTVRSNLMWDSAMAENGILKVGRITDFEAHQIEHQVGAYTDCNHGQGLAVIQPVYYRMIYPYAITKFARFARNVWNVQVDGNEEETAKAGIETLETFIKECNLPIKLTDLKMKDDPSVLLTDENLRKIADSCNTLKGGYKELTHDDIYEILKACR